METENIKSLSDLHCYIDYNAVSLIMEYELTSVLLRFKENATSEEEKTKVQWEIEISEFSFIGGKLFSFASAPTEPVGYISGYPALEELQAQGADYIQERIEQSTSPLLKARYAHALWEGMKKNNKFAKIASDNYIKVIKSILSADVEKKLFAAKLFENQLTVCEQSKMGLDECKLVANAILFHKKVPFFIKINILETMLEHSKIFKPEDFTGTLDIFEKHLKETNTVDIFLMISNQIEIALKIAQKTKSDVKIWFEILGDMNTKMAEKETEPSRNWIKLGFFQSAIDAYRKAGNKVKKKALEQKYFELKPDVKLNKTRIDFGDDIATSLKSHNEELKKRAKTILKLNPEQIYSQIAAGLFFPKYKYILEESKKTNEPSFFKGIKTFHFDENKNISKRDDKETDQLNLMDSYRMHTQATLLPFLHYLIIGGIKSGRLTHKNMLAFFIDHTWIGKPHLKYDLSGDPEENNWINQIAPSIVEFYVQVLAWGESKFYLPSFMLCIESLTLKIEGLFRNFSERINISTSKGNKQGVQEVLLHDVLDNEIIRQYFNEDDRLLFDYVFSNEGLNLRNNIAHCFYSEKEFHPDKMLMLLAVLFRLGNTTFQ